ncbi:MAG: nucleotidyltransferase domain-containing protein [Candidatus Hodarchaeales archaeon]|jgi:predicted nucleotidyltransferase
MIIKWAEELLDQLNKEYHIHFFAIFGSYLSDDYSFGSDIDIIVLQSNDQILSFEKVLTQALKISKKIDWEIHLYTIHQFVDGLKA